MALDVDGRYQIMDSHLISQLSDLEIFALTVYGEARGEPIEGQVAVANVINNRSISSNKTIKAVCLAPLQFSCWNENDSNSKILEEFANKMVFNQEIDDIHFKQIMYLVRGVRDNDLLDNTQNAHNYLTKNLYASDHAPKWAKSMNPIVEIGNHVFGTAV